MTAAPPRGRLERLLRPRSIAVVGASPDPTAIGGAPVALLEEFGFSGPVHLVSRSQRTIRGRACLPSVDELPDDVDVALLLVPRDAAASVLAACIRRRVGAVVLFGSGFAEIGDEGEVAQRGLAEQARAAGIAFAGPNCLGVVNFTAGVPLTFGDVEPQPPGDGDRPGLAIIAQSGALSFALLYAAAADGVPLSYVISTGNEAVLGVEDYLEDLVADRGTRAFALLVEQIRHPARFLAAAREAQRLGKTICLLHTGTSERGRAAARTHTGALGGDQAALRAVLARHGVILCDSLDELVDVAGCVTRCAAPTAGGVAFLTDSGALKAHALDVCAALGLDAPEPNPETRAALAAILPSFATVSNPVDITAQALNDPSLYARAGAALLDDAAVGALVVAAMPGSPGQFAQQVDALLPVVRASAKPILYSVLGGLRPLPARDEARLRAAGIPLFRSPERALRAANRLLGAAEARRRAGQGAGSAPAAAALALPASHAPTEHEAKQVLRALGIAVPDGALVTTAGDAARAAARLGYPVVLKAQAGALTHKSDAGGVILGIADEPALMRAWQRLHDDVRRARPGLTLDGVLVEKMSAPGGVEFVLAAQRDRDWGPVLYVGLGGIWIEALRDVRVLAAEATPDEIRHELRQLAGWPLLTGARGRPPADVSALCDAIVAFGRAVAATPAITAFEINPLLVLPAGQGVVALDAVLVSETVSETVPGRAP